MHREKKKNFCPFEMTMKVWQSNPKLCFISIEGSHNHDFGFHAQSFQSILPETIERIHCLFDKKNTPSETKKIIERDIAYEKLTDRSLYPRYCDYYRLFYKWQLAKFGADNGPEMFMKLESKLELEYTGKFYYSRIYILTMIN